MAFTITSSLVSTSAAYAETNIDEPFKKLFSGIASWYGGKFHGRRTASGSKYNMHQMTCAHKTLPFGTKLLVENQTNGKMCQVTVTDRGPYHGKRVIDLSKAAADKLGMDGISNVVCYLGRVVTKGIGGTAKGIGETAKGIGETAKGIGGTAKETGETIANLPGNLGKVAKEIQETAREVKSRGLSVASKPMSKQAYRKQIERYYAEKTLAFEANEISSRQFQGSFEPRAKTGCLLIPESSISDKNRATTSVLAGLEQDIY
jgi:rare lipoprotein A